jgi:hypothetical protein
MRAFDRRHDFEDAAFMRMVHAANTKHARQAEKEYEAIAAAGDKVYERAMKRIAKKYPGIPFPPCLEHLSQE